ncbi:MAG: TrkH family potassium uptake protein, partial [Actinomycetia bacterium]|nr:TrkH family potassium uptake protein [Actinomycetes bacterium]
VDRRATAVIRYSHDKLFRGRYRSAPALTVGVVWFMGGLAVLPAAALDLVTKGDHPLSLLLASAILVTIGLPLVLAVRLPARMSTQGLFSSLVFGALAMMTAGAVVHLATGAVDSVVDAITEGAAGVSTTAASVVVDPSELSRGEQLFRAMLQWGSGVMSLMAIVKVFPRLGIGGLQAEGGVATRAAARLSPTTGGNVRRLTALYVLFTGLIATGYFLAGMPLLDAILQSLTTASTGGWTTRAGSLGAFDSAAIEWVAVAGMFVAGISLPFGFRVLRTGRVALFWRSYEFRGYVTLVVVSWWILVAWSGDWSMSGIRAGVFAATSATSTTGMFTVNPDHFNGQGVSLLITLVAVGGMSASLTGGIRIARVLVMFGVMQREITRQMHEHSVKMVRVGRSTVGDAVVSRMLGEVALNALVASFGYLALAVFGDDVLSAIGAAVSLLATAGPAYGSPDPASTLTALEPAGRIVAVVLMMLGRISILPVLGVIAIGTKPMRRRVRLRRGTLVRDRGDR